MLGCVWLETEVFAVRRRWPSSIALRASNDLRGTELIAARGDVVANLVSGLERGDVTEHGGRVEVHALPEGPMQVAPLLQWLDVSDVADDVGFWKIEHHD